MNYFEKTLYFLQGTMETPTPFGWFHWWCIIITGVLIAFLYSIKNYHSEKQLKVILGTYGMIALILEILKQITWSFNYDSITGIVTWDYQWYAFPFQLCTTPIFVSLICIFLKNTKPRKALLSYMAFVTILGSISAIFLPESCFTEDILINIHTMWLHCGSFVVSVYLLMSREVKLEKENLKNSIKVFLVFCIIALFLNILVYSSGILHGEEFNMFYISPFFISSLPVFDIIQQNVPYIKFLALYIVALTLGAIIIFHISLSIERLLTNNKISDNSKNQIC